MNCRPPGSTLNWERARPHETDNIFQMHQYWIDAYKRQALRNALDNCKIIAMQPMKIKEDAFYGAITLRIWAEGNDYHTRPRRQSGVWLAASVCVAGANIGRSSEIAEPRLCRAHADLNCRIAALIEDHATGIASSAAAR